MRKYIRQGVSFALAALVGFVLASSQSRAEPEVAPNLPPGSAKAQDFVAPTCDGKLCPSPLQCCNACTPGRPPQCQLSCLPC